MSCIKFPSSKNDLSKVSDKEKVDDHAAVSVQLIASANQVFGQGKWSHSITSQTLDFIEYITGKYHAGCVSIVRVQLSNGTFHENMGYCYTEGSTKGSAIKKARFGSYNDAMKKALMSFGSEITNKINRPTSRPSSPAAVESVPNNFLQVENKSAVPTTSNKVVEEAFAEIIPMSQTDALMGNVDLDQLFDKDQNSNTINSKELKIGPSTSSGINISINKDNKKSNGISKLDIYESKSTVLTGIDNSTNKDNKSNSNSIIKKEIKTDVPKAVVSTAMTEEEMRLERKRKQREMQEEFKRQQEIKKKYTETGNKQLPNPRY